MNDKRRTPLETAVAAGIATAAVLALPASFASAATGDRSYAPLDDPTEFDFSNTEFSFSPDSNFIDLSSSYPVDANSYDLFDGSSLTIDTEPAYALNTFDNDSFGNPQSVRLARGGGRSVQNPLPRGVEETPASLKAWKRTKGLLENLDGYEKATNGWEQLRSLNSENRKAGLPEYRTNVETQGGMPANNHGLVEIYDSQTN